MEGTLIIILALLIVVALLSIISNKIGIAYPIILVIAGLILSAIPAVPNITIDPDLIFIIFLPPLLFAAAWNTSWRDFWFYKRAIVLLAIGLVIFTSVSIAFISNALIPGFSLASGFLLGGIISPSDAIAATSIIRRLKVPKRVTTILEGESLLNDASSLIVFRFALMAVATGKFVLADASVNFLLVAGGGILFGLAIGFIIYLFYRFLPTDSAIDTSMALITPYLMYILAERFHCSGVLSVVSGGLFLSFRSGKIFNYESRMQVMSVYRAVEFLMNGVLFIMIGLELKYVVNGIKESSLPRAFFYAFIISIAAVLIRIIWVFPGTYLPRISRKIREREKAPSWKSVFIVAWSGMRGVVSLASALTVPVFIVPGKYFPHRNLTLFITFSVILFTLVIQGISLPFIIRLLKIKVDDSNEEASLQLNTALGTVVIDHLKSNYGDKLSACKDLQALMSRYETLMLRTDKLKENALTKKQLKEEQKNRKKVFLELVQLQREMIQNLRLSGEYPDEVLRSKEYELDLEEARVRGNV